MEQKHTPGPWYVDNNAVRSALKPNDSGFVAHCYNPQDAELIAQAPDLLAKVSEMKKEIDRLAWEKISLYTLSKDQETEIENSDNQKDEYRQKLSEQSQRIQQLEEERKDLVEALREVFQEQLPNNANGGITSPLWYKIESILSKF